MSKLILVLALAGLKASKNTQVRLELNEEALSSYTDYAKECKAAGADPQFPPLVVFRDEKGDHLGDGFTRRAALKEAGFTEYPCEIKEGSAWDAFLYGAKVNQEHGARLTNKDKKNILHIALENKEYVELSDNALAKELGLTTNYVFRNRPASKKPGVVTRVSKTGKKSKIKTANIGKGGGSTKKTKKDKSAPSEKAKAKAEETTKQYIDKIVDASCEDGKAKQNLRTALSTGTIKADAKDLKKWTTTTPERIKKISALVVDLRKSVTEAIKIIDNALTEKSKFGEGVLAAIAGGGVDHQRIEGSDFKYVIYDPKSFAVEISPK